jgi:hypothetical protein
MKILFFFAGDLVLEVENPGIHPSDGDEVSLKCVRADGLFFVESMLWVYDPIQGDRLDIILKELP